MRIPIVLLVTLCLLCSCSESESAPKLEEPCAGVIDFIGPSAFLITLVDTDGGNLIENGFYIASKISADLNGRLTWYDVVKSDTIRLQPFSLSDGSEMETEYRLLLKLSETDTDTLDYFLSFEEVKEKSRGVLFCGTKIMLDSANYNGIDIVLKKDTGYPQFTIPITIVKTGN